MTRNQPGPAAAGKPRSNVATGALGQASDLSPVSWRAAARLVARIVRPAGRAGPRVRVRTCAPRLAARSARRPARVDHPPATYRAPPASARQRRWWANDAESRPGPLAHGGDNNN